MIQCWPVQRRRPVRHWLITAVCRFIRKLWKLFDDYFQSQEAKAMVFCSTHRLRDVRQARPLLSEFFALILEFAGTLEIKTTQTLRLRPMRGYALAKHLKSVSDNLLQIRIGSGGTLRGSPTNAAARRPK